MTNAMVLNTADVIKIIADTFRVPENDVVKLDGSTYIVTFKEGVKRSNENT